MFMVHKRPTITWPVVSRVGSALNVYSKRQPHENACRLSSYIPMRLNPDYPKEQNSLQPMPSQCLLTSTAKMEHA